MGQGQRRGYTLCRPHYLRSDWRPLPPGHGPGSALHPVCPTCTLLDDSYRSDQRGGSHSAPLPSSGGSCLLGFGRSADTFTESERGHTRLSSWPLCERASKVFWKRPTCLKLSMTYAMHLKEGFKAHISISFLAFFTTG